MRTSLRVTFFTLFSTTLVFACSHKVSCEDSNITIAYKAFSQQQLDTIIMRRYVKGSNFTQLKDTSLFNTSNYQTIITSDTIQFMPTAGMPFSPDSISIMTLTPDYDYEIYVLSLNKLTQISNITEEKIEGNGSGIFSMDPRICYNPILSYINNGQTVTNGTSLYNLIITK